MAGSAQRQKVYVQVTELCLLAKALRATSIALESPAKARQIAPRFTDLIVGAHFADSWVFRSCSGQPYW